MVLILTVSFTLKKKPKSRVEQLLASMTLKEKIGQMTQINIDVVSKGEVFKLQEPHSLDSAKLHKVVVEYGVGSLLNVGGHAYDLAHWQAMMTEIQRVAKQKTRLHIPVLYGIDAIHGANYLLEGTLFPQPLAQAATFNPSLVNQAAAVTAYECRATGVPWNFSPVLDVARQPLWSRVFETYGEDVHLAKTMGAAAITGYQSEDPSHPEKVAACMKHFLGYSMPFTGKDRTSVYLSEIQLREYFLPTFQEAIRNGAMSVMINSGDINGVPVHANADILTQLLRKELKFEGVAVTDWEDIMKLVSIHHVAANHKEAVKIAVNAGIDMSMVPNDLKFADYLYELVNEGAVPMSRIDESVLRILTMKEKLGLFDQALPFQKRNYPLVGSDSFKQVAHQTAAEGTTLLKNTNSILPLSPSKKLLVMGPAAKSISMVNGAWTRTWQGTGTSLDEPNKASLWDVLEQHYPQSNYLQACSIDSLYASEADVISAADNCDAIVLCLGEKPSTEKPGDIHDLNMSRAQQQLVHYCAKTGKPIVLVLVENRPLIVWEIEPLCDAILLAYQPSENGLEALGDILSGAINPSGKLPITYPRHTNTLLPYDHRHADRLNTDFSETAFRPQWEFGHGLSYTQFSYSKLEVTPLAGTFRIRVDVRNTGSVAGKETALLFVSDVVASIAPPVKRLRGYQKKSIPAGETATFTFEIRAEDLAFVNKELKWVTEPGTFIITIGGLSTEITLNN
jgi:beta-glucosidase